MYLVRQAPKALLCCIFLSVPLAGVLAGEQAAGGPQIGGILYNEDDSHRFSLDPAGTMKPQRLDQIVDELADSSVRVMLICCCAKKTNFPSKAWEVHCEGFVPARDDSQPYFGDVKPEDCKWFRQWAHNLRVMLDAGVDPTGRMLARCRQRGISPWVSIRMNDVHDAGLLNSPLHSRFWRDHPEYWRYPERYTISYDRCLNYGLEPVRDHTMALIKEVCQRYDLDGLELDWNRFPRHFREGEELRQGKVLNEWMAEVRRVVQAAEKRWDHPVRLAARVPARPEVAVGMGLDAVSWAKRGLVDHLIVAPFFTTTDFDIPVERWVELLRGTGVGVTAGLEIRVQSYPGGPTLPNTAPRRRGAAMAALARGSQGIYLFNHFDVPEKMPYLLDELHSIEAMKGKDRDYVVTFADISVPGRPIPPSLPMRLSPGQSAEFRLFTGPKPVAGARGEVHLQIADEEEKGKAAPQVHLNGRPIGAGTTAKFAGDLFRRGHQTIRVTNVGESPLKVEVVELSVRFDDG